MSGLMEHVRRWQEKCKLAGEFLPELLMEEMEPVFRAEGYREKPPGGQEKIMILNLNAIGDNILYSAFYRELRRAYPRAFITLLATPLVYPLMELCPYVNRVLSIDIAVSRPPEKNLPALLQLCEELLWDEHITMTFCSQWSEEKRSVNLLAYLSGARERIAVSDDSLLIWLPDWAELPEQWECLLTRPIVTPKPLLHEVGRALYPLVELGFEVQDDRTEIWFDGRDVFLARQVLREVPTDGIGVAVGIGAGGASRKYPVEKYVQAMKQLLSKGPFFFVVIGGPSERADGQWIAQQMPEGTVWNLAGAVELRTTLAVMSQMQLYLGNDTGIMHAACALGLPVAAVFREAVDKASTFQGVCSELSRFAPWRTKAIILQPEHALGACRDVPAYGGCQEREAHCICQVRPEELVEAVLCLLDEK